METNEPVTPEECDDESSVNTDVMDPKDCHFQDAHPRYPGKCFCCCWGMHLSGWCE